MSVRKILIHSIVACGMLEAASHGVTPEGNRPTATGEVSRSTVKSLSKEEEKLRLMFQVFTYSNDTKNAYKVAKKALKRFPESLYWHQRLAEVAEWMGKGREAMDHYLFVYRKTHDRKLGKKILDYALEDYQYEKALPLAREKALRNPDRKNLNLLLDLYDKVGKPEEGAAILEKLVGEDRIPGSWLDRALTIYLQSGEEKAAGRVIAQLERKGAYTLSEGTLISEHFIARREFEKAYQALKKTRLSKADLAAKVRYLRQMSDLGWYLRKQGDAARASRELFLLGKARAVDYERILNYYRGRDSELVQQVAYDGYRKLGRKYMLLSYFDTLYQRGRYRELADSIEEAMEGTGGAALRKQSGLWLMLSEAYAKLHRDAKSLEALQQALALDPHSAELRAALLWFYIDHDMDKEMAAMVRRLEEDPDGIPEVLWLPLASANAKLQRGDRAMGYIKRLLERHPRNPDVRILYAYAMQERGEEGAFRKTMGTLFEEFDAKRRSNPALLKDPTFLQYYLSTALYFLPIDDFDELLRRSRGVLKPADQAEMEILRALRHDSVARARYLAQRLRKVPAWMRLNIALADYDTVRMQDLLYRRWMELPVRDRVEAALRTGNMALAQSGAFEGLENNRMDSELYLQMRDMVEEYSDFVDLYSEFQRREDFDRIPWILSGRYYLGEAWTLYFRGEYARNRLQDDRTFRTVPNEDHSLAIDLRRRLERGWFSLGTGYRWAMDDAPFYRAMFHYEPLRRWSVELGYADSIVADESAFLLLGGKKDELRFQTVWQYLPSSSITLTLSRQEFQSQDDVDLGEGYRVQLEWFQQIRQGYPDLSWGIFSDLGRYDEVLDHGAGVIDTLLLHPGEERILPEDFWNVGLTFNYGLANKDHFTRVWRPYASFSPYVDLESGKFSFSLDLGIGGEIYDRDHLNTGISYDQSSAGTEEKTLRFYLHYKHFF